MTHGAPATAERACVCGRPAAPRRGVCWGHWKRTRGVADEEERARRLESPLRPWGQAPWEAVLHAALGLGEADPADPMDWQRALERLRWAARRYARSLPRGLILAPGEVGTFAELAEAAWAWCETPAEDEQAFLVGRTLLEWAAVAYARRLRRR